DCQIIFEVPAALHGLFAAQKPTFRIITAGDPIPHFDVHCPLMSLPLAFKTAMETIPARIPYLAAPAAKREFWRGKMGRRSKPKIGLYWSGSLKSTHDIRRNMPLELLLPILNENAEWHSLQKDVWDRDRDALDSCSNIIDHAPELIDFIDTAALINEL